MDSIFKSMVGFFFLVLMSVTSICVITASIDNSNAQNYHTAIISEVEDSDYSPAVIKTLGETAVNEGYELRMVFHHNDGSTSEAIYTKDDYGTYPNNLEDVAFAEVQLKFNFSFKLMGLTAVPHTLKGIAR